MSRSESHASHAADAQGRTTGVWLWVAARCVSSVTKISRPADQNNHPIGLRGRRAARKAPTSPNEVMVAAIANAWTNGVSAGNGLAKVPQRMAALSNRATSQTSALRRRPNLPGER